MDSEDGQIFVKKLAYFVHTHERALANALQSRNKNDTQTTTTGASSSTSSLPASIRLSEALSRSYIPFSSQPIKPAKLALTPHHLFYLLSKFEDLGVDIGPMNVRLENLRYNAAPSNYVSFLGNAPKTKGKQSDADSLRSVSSVRSVVSSMSSFWSNLTSSNSAAKAEKQIAQYRADIKYLYSCFTKIPALKLSPDHRARSIAGFEEFPFDTAVPLFCFKNVSALEICDIDFRQFHGWDRLCEQLRSLNLKRANVDDPIDILLYIVLDDMEKRRKRSSKPNLPATPSTPGVPWPTTSPKLRQVELARTNSAPSSPFLGQRRGSKDSPHSLTLDSAEERLRNGSPGRTTTSRQESRQDSLSKHMRTNSLKYRRSSTSSGSDINETTPRHSTTDLLAPVTLPSSKWRFLRHLSLAENGLTFLAETSLAPVAGTLQSLDLSANLFTEVPDALASLTHLRALNLSNCMINGLQSLARHPLPAIVTLNLRSNRLSNLSGIERLISLERVDLRDNRLRDPTELARLTGFPDIADIYVARNPFVRTHSNYRITIFNLFRSAPGHVQDITIDTLPPLHHEKNTLVDRVPDLPNKPVIQPPLEDEEESQAVAGGAPTASELRALTLKEDEPPAQRNPHGHRRAISDVGPESMRRKKRAPRRRIVELAQAEALSRPTSQHTERDFVGLPPQTPTDSDQPVTPDQTPYYTAPLSPVEALSSSKLPTLNTAFSTPTPAPKIRDASDNDDSPVRSPQDFSDLYRQKIESLKSDLGPRFLTALHEGGMPEDEERDRSFSPVSRTSTIRPESKAHGVSVGNRALG